jgi:hypothetical protein
MSGQADQASTSSDGRPSDGNPPPPQNLGPTEQGVPFQTAEENLLSDVNAAELSPADIQQAEAQVAMYTQEARGWIPFEKIAVDEDMERGQSRQLDNSRVQQYIEHVRNNPKRGPLEDLLAIPTAQRGMFVTYS